MKKSTIAAAQAIVASGLDRVEQSVDAHIAATNEPAALANINGKYVFAETPLTWLISANPKRPSGKAYSRFEKYMLAPTVQSYMDNGGTLADLKYDNAKKFLEI